MRRWDWTDWMMLVLVTLIVGVVWAAIASASSPVIEIPKNEWACTQSHLIHSSIPVSTGKTTVLIPQTRSVCDRYERKTP